MLKQFDQTKRELKMPGKAHFNEHRNRHTTINFDCGGMPISSSQHGTLSTCGIAGAHPKRFTAERSTGTWGTEEQDPPPRTQRFVAEPRNPLNPHYNVPPVVEEVFESPKFVRDAMDVSDIEGARVRRRLLPFMTFPLVHAWASKFSMSSFHEQCMRIFVVAYLITLLFLPTMQKSNTLRVRDGMPSLDASDIEGTRARPRTKAAPSGRMSSLDVADISTKRAPPLPRREDGAMRSDPTVDVGAIKNAEWRVENSCFVLRSP
jgi:hypothetical protein